MTQTAINKHDISFSTVAVEIQIVRIGGKQMTLSVFDQVIEESILDKRATSLKGEPIGKIRSKSKWFVLWTKNGELRKCELPTLKQGVSTAESALDVIREGLKTEEKSIYRSENTYLDTELKFKGFCNMGKQFMAIEPQEIRKILVLNGFRVNEVFKEWGQTGVLLLGKDRKASQVTCIPYMETSKRMLRFPLDILAKSENNLETSLMSEEMQAVIKELKRLEQLFIAV